MYKPYKTSIVKASADVKVPEPKISKLALLMIATLGWGYLFLFFGVAKIVLRGKHILFDSFKRALDDKCRTIIAFRHPNGGEPQLLTMFFHYKLKGLARKYKIKFKRTPHAAFVYGYEVSRWGGWLARYLMPNLGAMPIYHSKMDKKGMERIYNAIINGPYPLAIAPEGQVSYTTNSVPRLENGIIRIGMKAAEKLEVKDKDVPVEILPLSIYFRFGVWGKFFMKQLIHKIERFCGYKPSKSKHLNITERLGRLREHILELNEQRYKIDINKELPFEERLDNVIYAAIETAERMLNLKPEGDLHARMYKVRQICWDRIFIPGVNNLDKMSRIQRNLLDLGAGEAWHIARHQELVDFSIYFKRPLPAEEDELHNKVEYVQNLWDFANRTMGGAIANRANIFPRSVYIHAAPPINLSAHLEDYRKDKKTVINDLLEELKKSYNDTIEEANKPGQSKKDQRRHK